MSLSHNHTARATLAIHGGKSHAKAGDPVVSPLVQSANFTQEFGGGGEIIYGRSGNLPNAESVQKRIALLEGAEAALLLSSGMGATACAILALLRAGDHLVASSWIYGGTRDFLSSDLASMGVETTFVDPLQPRDWRRALRKTTRAIFIESPVNPTCRLMDIAPISMLAKLEGLALVVDSTIATPMNLRPLEHGADIVIHSGTKYLNGHHDALCGIVAGSAPFIEEVRRKMTNWGQAPDPFACWLLERGLKTLDVRIARHNDNALKLARWCSDHPAVARVHYPGLPGQPDHEIAKRTMDGFGGMLAIELTGGVDAVERMLPRLRLFIHAPGFGGVESLVSEPRYTSHSHLSQEERANMGFPDGFLRFSVGIEDPGDLIADLENALH